MKDNVKVSMVIIFIITILVLSIIPLTVQSVVFENSYGKLEVYPDVSRNIIRQKQFFNATNYLPSQDLDIAFRFNESLSYGGVYYFNGTSYNKLNVEHIEYNNKHWYLLNDIYFETDEVKHGYWEYEVNGEIGNNSGKWDMFIKRSSDSLQYAIDNNLYVHLDPWWNSSYGLRNNSIISDKITDYSVNFNLSYTNFFDSRCQNNFNDIRFVGDNTTELYYYYYDKVDSGYIAGFINISDASYISIYWNNSEVSESSYVSGVKTFKYMFEPFNNLDDWAQAENPADTGSDYSIVSDRIYIDADTGDSHFVYTPINFSKEVKICYFGLETVNIGVLQLIFQSETDYNIGYSLTKYARHEIYDQTSGGGGNTDHGSSLDNGPTSEEYDRIYDVGDEIYTLSYLGFNILSDLKVNSIIDSVSVGTSSISLSNENYYLDIYTNNGRGVSKYYIDDIAVGIYNSTEPNFTWLGLEEVPLGCTCILNNYNPVNGSIGIDWNNLNLSVLVNSSLGCDIDYVYISLNNGSFNYFYNWSVGNYSNSTFYYNTTFNLSSATEYKVYFNTSCNGTVNNTWINFTTFGVTLDDVYNLQIYMNNNMIKGDDEVDINLGLDGTLLTLTLFGLFFIVGYIINKRSGGVLMLFSGFILISFELVANINLDALYLVPLLTPIAILIMILGVRKWLYPVEGEKTKSEGQ